MKNYYIETITQFSVADFNESVTNVIIDSLHNKNVVKAENPIQAVKKYFKETLLYSFEEEHADIEDERNEVSSPIYYNYVDYDKKEIDPNGKVMARFKKAEIKLILATTYLEICELVPTKL